MKAQQPVLEIHQLHVAYGVVQAVQGLSLKLFAGELVSLIGANGAGKTTTLKAVTGLLPPSSGDVSLFGESIGALSTAERSAKGLVMVPEGRGVFARMSIEENLRAGAYLRHDKAAIEADMGQIYQRFPRLKERYKQLAGTLSGGEQQMLAMGRALMMQPKVLLLDEPSMGLSPIMVDTIFEVIQDISRQGVTVLLVEQNAYRALHMSQRGYVMESGRLSAQGPASSLLNDTQVRAAYLGL